MDDENEEHKDVSIEDDLAAAFDEVEDVEEEQEDEPDNEDEQEEEESEEDDSESDEEDGDEDESDDDESDEDEDEPSDEDEDGDEEEEGEGEDDNESSGDGRDDNESGDSGRAPVSWSPEVREEWSKLPASVQAQITKRENEISQTLGESTRARRFTQAWEQMLDPYIPLMAAQGANAMGGVQRLLQVASTLSVGNTAQKASMIKNLMDQYEVDIGTLDQMLAGEVETVDTGNVAPQPQDVQSQVNMALANRDAEARNNQFATELQAFEADPKNEFFADVRGTMADLLELRERQGQSPTIQELYDEACKMTPSVQQVLEKRALAESKKKKSAAMKRKKKAASSVKGKASKSATKQKELSMDDEVAAAWASAEKRQARRL